MGNRVPLNRYAAAQWCFSADLIFFKSPDLYGVVCSHLLLFCDHTQQHCSDIFQCSDSQLFDSWSVFFLGYDAKSLINLIMKYEFKKKNLNNKKDQSLKILVTAIKIRPKKKPPKYS